MPFKNHIISKTFFAFGTANTITAFNSKDLEALEAVKKHMLKLDDMLSAFKENSEVSKINHLAGSDYVTVSEETFLLADSAMHYSSCSKGLFDITSRPLSKLWNFNNPSPQVPQKREIEKAIKRVNYKDILIDKKNHKIMLSKKEMEIDFGAIAKGFAVDEAQKILEAYCVKKAIINFGGTVKLLGIKQEVGIRHPLEKEKIFGTILLENQSVVTSGCYEKCFFDCGKRYHHILNPKTGYPSESGIISATIIGDSAMELDALATTVLLLGLEYGLKLINEFGLQGILVCDDYKIFVTDGLKNKFTLLENQ